jgi:sialidase-1
VYRRAITVSPDGISGWSEPRFDPALFEPWCEASLLRISSPPKSKNRILFCNPDSRGAPPDTRPGIGRKSRPRVNLTIRLSYDDCRTWPVSKVIDPGVAGYSDMAMAPDGTLLCLYEKGSVNGSQTANSSLSLVRFNLAWLTDGRDKGP